MTKVLLIGATGMASQEIYQAATKAGLAVTAQVRHADKVRELFGTGVTVLEQDALTLSKDELANFDVVVNAFSTSPAEADNHQKLAEHLVHRLGGDQRLLVILGAGSLLDGADDHLVVDDIKKAPGADAWIAIPEGQKKELDYLRTVSGIDWVGISPSYTFKPGLASDQMLVGNDHLLRNDAGESYTTAGTMAKAMVAEILHPAHHRECFTVANS